VITLYAKGQDVQVFDGTPVPPPVSSGSGVVTLYAKGQQVQVIDTAPVVSGPFDLVVSRPLNMSLLLEFDLFNSQGRYTRWVPNINDADLANGLYVRTNSHTGDNQPFKAPRYDLTLDGVVIASTVPPLGATKIRFPKFTAAQMAALPKVLGILDIVPSTATGETAHPCWINLLRSAPQTFAPGQTGSWGIAHEEGPTARLWKLPLQIDPPTFTLKPRTAVPFSHKAAATELFRRNLSPCINGDPPYLRTLQNGFRTTMNQQAYAFSTIGAKFPGLVLRDGPFGVGTLPGITHLQIGRVGGVYFTDPWRFGHMEPNGTIRTIAGYRHADAGLELVGDWSAIPLERRGFHELWGAAWWPRSVSEATLDDSQVIDGENPHLNPPVVLLPDSQNNRVCALEFTPTDRRVPPKVIELLTGLADPWDCVFIDDDTFAVSERKANKITLWTLARVNGALQATPAGVLVQGAPGYAVVGADHRVTRTATLDVIRTQPCVCPEGLVFQDDHLYFGSIAMSQVWKINTKTKARIKAWEGAPNSKQEYIKLGISDGTSMPRGTLGLSRWDVLNEGAPLIVFPDGTLGNLIKTGSDNLPSGPGGEWSGIGYATACTFGQGRCLYAGADYGVIELTLAQGEPKLDEARYVRGRDQYNRAGMRAVCGIDGFSQWKAALDKFKPRQISADVAYFLDCHQ
jgi:hypothetical protein